ncbi:MAG: Na+/H+ antiporter NhaA [Calditrichia bacterium]
MKVLKNYFQEFFKMESAGGLVLMAFALLAVIVANSPLYDGYAQLWMIPFEIRLGTFALSKPLLLWINDGLMAVFFFLVGLELKREFVEGEFADKKNVILPMMGAIGGMLVPALIYSAFNWNDPIAMRGWAIPAATDIAFALGVLSLLGSRVPVSLKVFLTSLAIFDDIGAIIIIAIFYTAKISFMALLIALFCILVLFLFNRLKIYSKSPYLLVGLIMWVAVLKSGVHATLAGVVLAFFIPMRAEEKNGNSYSPLKELEHDLHSIVAFFVLPVFAFANSGLRLIGVGADFFVHSVPVGIAAGLFFGKQIGIFLFVWIVVVMKIVKLPQGLNWGSLYGVAALAGIGFTMSLFIGTLAFENITADILFDERLGIIAGSLLSGLVGAFILRFTLKLPDKLKS